MFGKDLKERKFVVMDGSDKRFVKEIIGVIEMTVGKPRIFNGKKIKYQRMNPDHPTMLVFTVKSNYRSWDMMRRILEKQYPAQCVFTAPL